MKLIVGFMKPYAQMTIEQGKNIKDCIRNALIKFDGEFISGCDSIEQMVKNNADLQRNKDMRDRAFFYEDYDWEIKVYDFATDTIFDAAEVLDEIIEDIHDKIVKKWSRLEWNDKVRQYRHLKKELAIE